MCIMFVSSGDYEKHNNNKILENIQSKNDALQKN